MKKNIKPPQVRSKLSSKYPSLHVHKVLAKVLKELATHVKQTVALEHVLQEYPQAPINIILYPHKRDLIHRQRIQQYKDKYL